MHNGIKSDYLYYHLRVSFLLLHLNFLLIMFFYWCSEWTENISSVAFLILHFSEINIKHICSAKALDDTYGF